VVAARVFIVLVSTMGTALASPNVSVDDPVYERLAQLEALGHLPPTFGGFLPLSEHQVQELLRRAGTAEPRFSTLDMSGWWLVPLRRARANAGITRDTLRPYSTLPRPRNITGALAISCERTEGRACGDGVASSLELETAGGWRRTFAAALRLRVETGTGDHDSDAVVDRAYASGELGPVNVEVGRDVVVYGPRARTQLAWGLHAPPLDHARISTAHPWRVTRAFHVNGQYVVGRLRAPQRYPGNLVSIMRAQADVGDSLQLGLLQMLQLGGEGAPQLSFVDFVLEHVRRRDFTATETDTSNRRFGGDVSARISALQGLRLYYSVIFEDIRRARWIDAVRYDADHLAGLELAAIGPGRRHGITLEWQQTGVRSQEHGPRSTGFTNAGRAVGSALGPDSQSFYVGARIELDGAALYPWVELVQSRSDVYQFVEYGPILRTTQGIDEGRYRLGVRGRVFLRTNQWLECETFFERIDDLGFQSSAQRNNAGISATMVWYPGTTVSTIARD
jgi:hypothetical protein